MSNFTKKEISEEDLEDIVNNNDNSEVNDDNSQSYGSDMSSENISRSISFG